MWVYVSCMNRLIRIAPLVILLGAGLASCGGDEDVAGNSCTLIAELKRDKSSFSAALGTSLAALEYRAESGTGTIVINGKATVSVPAAELGSMRFASGELAIFDGTPKVASATFAIESGASQSTASTAVHVEYAYQQSSSVASTVHLRLVNLSQAGSEDARNLSDVSITVSRCQ
jgi:hypothetical protein